MSKKFVRSYQPRDPATGEAIGTLQTFEADTEAELCDKLAAAHENASVKVYKTMLAAKVGTLLNVDPDPAMPVKTYEEEVISADERVKLATALKDPANTDHVIKKLMKSFGIPVEDIRQVLQERELSRQQTFVNEQVALFKEAHPEFVESEFNNSTILKYLQKRSMGCTKKNLEIAYADLTSDGLLTVRAAEPIIPVSPAPAPTPAAAPASNAPAPEPAIPATATNAAPISAQPTEVRAKVSSSGLGRDNSSAVPGTAAPKAPEITAQDIARMSSKEYSDRLRDPAFRKLVDNLGRKAASS